MWLQPAAMQEPMSEEDNKSGKTRILLAQPSNVVLKPIEQSKNYRRSQIANGTNTTFYCMQVMESNQPVMK